ncbi:uncharacterized protein LALA0_S06e02322g [Lachancea lanzarotensis]|uniref:LALA0S06e02322g1_1 n=1 Tax=Lachancea lanzarotensis TaxID=1245769 RepID=A0A0C7N436_9SACH|nr:uncharacterized protein LALA0_S06e02322g [Lachancea lanzarotensis]CEP62726.1 LALA0S06e02322g1_1 [Lachancea lanzarotensis]
MAFRLIMVDPRPAMKNEGSAASQRRSHINKTTSEITEQGDLSLMIHSFDSGQTFKVPRSCKTAVGKKKTNKAGKGRGSSDGQRLVFCSPSFTSAKTSKTIEQAVHSEQTRKPVKDKLALTSRQRDLTFVSSITDDYHLEYANPWQSSFEFDGRKPQRPLFRITSPKLRKNVTKPNGHMNLSNVINPSFAFSHNSLNESNDRSTKQRQIAFDTSPIFKVSLNNR